MSHNKPDDIYKTWAKHAAQNALSLSEESVILLEANKLERAYYLAHMSTEEAAKAKLLIYLPFLGVPLGESKKINNLLRNHKKKIELILDFAKFHGLEDEINQHQEALTKYINDKKNNTMYVSYSKNKFSIPANIIKSIDVNLFVRFGTAFAKHTMLLCKNISNS